MSKLLDVLVALGLIGRHWLMIRGEATSIAPTQVLANMVAEFGIQLSDIVSDEGKELIVLTMKRRGAYGRIGCQEINYIDSPSTCADRDAMSRLNAFLHDSDIAFLDDGQEPRVNPLDRTMKRFYVIYQGQDVRFDQSGRLCGGFWQNIKKGRRRNIRINGEPIVELDFSSMYTRMAYAAVGAVPPEGDLYAIPGLEGYRSGVKVVMNALLFDVKPRSRLPKGLGNGVGDDFAALSDPNSVAARYDARLPKGWPIKRMMKEILKVHPCLKDAWGRGLGITLMHQESEILLAVLLDLASRNIPALGLHDGLLVARGDMKIARAVMMEKGLEMTGILLPVRCK
jgi:hypothetical protein